MWSWLTSLSTARIDSGRTTTSLELLGSPGRSSIFSNVTMPNWPRIASLQLLNNASLPNSSAALCCTSVACIKQDTMQTLHKISAHASPQHQLSVWDCVGWESQAVDRVCYQGRPLYRRGLQHSHRTTQQQWWHTTVMTSNPCQSHPCWRPNPINITCVVTRNLHCEAIQL